MPIRLDRLRGTNQIVQEVEFGSGDILMVGVRDLVTNVENELWFVSDGVPKPKSDWTAINTCDYVSGHLIDELPTQKNTVALVFKDRDSIEFMIHTLRDMYNQMPPTAETDLADATDVPY
ncbi:hypothetical protein [Spirosoma sp. KNUC1025]|uniref:hypothetical protein n=1 Tax=Spirosoma sp. KNUC1025 TaxID=2894082 RepID=UPI003868F740|nr:hypothetical protein LN737_09505 [Spirosoma sp. KNUC1025]